MIAILLIAAWDHSYNLDIDFTYDDNVYAYSQSYIDDFLNSVRPYRFPFETYDDLTTSVDFALLLRNRLFGKRTTTFNFGLGTRNYLVNKQKNYQNYTIGLRQSLGRYAVKLSYQFIPNYMIRYYRNPFGESTEYIGCEVAYHLLTGKISFTTEQDIIISAAYRHKWDDYITEFNRYDAEAHIVSLAIEKKLHKFLEFAFSYDYKNARADSADVSTLSSELVPDGSYYEHDIALNLSLQTRVILATTFNCSYDYSFRRYNASTNEDSLHFSRIDHLHRIRFGSRSRIKTGLLFKLDFMRQWRNSTSEILPDIDEIKNYTKYRIGAGFEFYY
ncbi:MAG: hypothetical protein JSW49_05455 [candidate division WOR-3 bacterium]|nr:MAG: hypothetical protein JSW49_05455 [candidate division WOR-3 bacterium]